MKTKLSYMSERQSLLAQNVANADTPDYKAKDVKAPDFGKMLKTLNTSGGKTVQKLQLATTSSGHLANGVGPQSEFKTILRPNTDELNPNGNNVAIEEEMSKVAENQAEYQKVLSLYSKTIGMFKIAIGNPSGG